MKSKFRIDVIKNQRVDFGDGIRPSAAIERKYALFPNDDMVTITLYNNQLYEPYLYEFIYENRIDVEGTTIIDVGGNNGQIAIEFANLVGDEGCVHTFEPQRIIYQQLCGNIFMNGLDNVWAHNVALGSEIGKIDVEKPNYHSIGYVNFGDVHVGLKSENFEIVDVMPMDRYGLKNVSIIKIDVQGFEINVLRGAKKTIEENRPIIFIEVEDDQLSRYGESETSLIKEIEDMGYYAKRFYEDLTFMSSSGKCLDFVCIPKEKMVDRDFIVR